MTELLNATDTASDAELISRVRGGDTTAYGELFSRHVQAANRLSRQLVRGPDSDDLVSEAFAKVLQVLQGGGGPDVAFRAYLLTAVRRLHVDKIRAGSKLQTTGDMTPFDPGIPFQDTAVAGFENSAAAKAFASLPERWQLVLWHLEVEGQKPAEIAPLLGMSANSVSALAYRAREGLRQAFLTMHLADTSDAECRWVNEHLGAYVRNGLSKRDTAKVDTHREECRKCTAMYLELTEVNSSLAAIIAPLLLGAAAAGYLTSTGAAGASGIVLLFGRVKDAVIANSAAATAAGVAAGIAAIATATLLITQGGGQDIVAGPDQTVATTQTQGTQAPSGAPATPRSTPTPKTTTPPESISAPPVTVPGALVPIVNLASPGVTPLPNGQTSLPSDAASPDGRQSSDPTAAATNPGGSSGVTAPPAGSLVADIQLARVSVDSDNKLTVAVTGLPSQTSMMSVTLQARRGTTFDAALPAGCTPAGPTTVKCNPALTALGAGNVTAQFDATTGYTVTLPLAYPPDMVSDELTVTVSVDGYKGQDSRSLTFAPTHAASVSADVGLTLLPPVTQNDGSYQVTGALTGIPDGYTGETTYILTVGAASFTGSTTTGCTVTTPSKLTCAPATNGNVDFQITATDNTHPTDIQITVYPLTGYTGDTPDNNHFDTTLQAVTHTNTNNDLALTANLVNYDKGAKTADMPVTVTGAPSGTLTFTLDANAKAALASSSADCTISSGARSATCAFNGNGVFTRTFSLTGLPEGQTDKMMLSVEAEDNIDPDPGNSTGVPVQAPSSPRLAVKVFDSLTDIWSL